MQTPRGRVSGTPPSRRAPSEIADRPAAASRPVWVAPERQGTRGRRLRGAPPRTRVRRLRRARWLRDESWSYGAHLTLFRIVIKAFPEPTPGPNGPDGKGDVFVADEPGQWTEKRLTDTAVTGRNLGIGRRTGLRMTYAFELVRGFADGHPAPACRGSQLPARCPADPRQELHQLPSACFDTVRPRSHDVRQVPDRWQTRTCFRGRFAGTKPRDP